MSDDEFQDDPSRDPPTNHYARTLHLNKLRKKPQKKVVKVKPKEFPFENALLQSTDPVPSRPATFRPPTKKKVIYISLILLPKNRVDN